MKNIIKKILTHRILTAIVIFVLAGGGYISYRSFFQTSVSVPQYVTAKAQRGMLVVSVTGSGQVSASNQTNVAPQISGTILNVLVANNQRVAAGDLLVRLESTNEERAVRNAKANLQSAELALQTLKQPATNSTLLQAEGNTLQSQQTLQTSQNNLVTDYNSAYTDISNTIIDLGTVMPGLNAVLYGTTVNKPQSNIDAYSNLISTFYPNIAQYNQNAATSYQAALAAYNQNLIDYKNTTIYSSTSTIEALLTETYATLKTVSAANASAKNLLDLVGSVLQQNSAKIPAQLITDESNMQSYTASTNIHLATILQRNNSIQTDKQAIAAAGLSISQTAAALEQLKGGPTALAIQTQELNITQAKNALADAEQNLAYDSVRAPFAGIITNITAKKAQPAGPSTVLGILISDAQLAQASFNEVDIVSVKVGQKATIKFDALPGVTLTGKVSQVDTLGTVVQGVVSYNTQVALDIPNPLIKPGMSNTISIITNIKPDVLLVPNVAVSTRQGASSVQVMSAGGTVSQRQVTTGLSNDTLIEITSGLNEGDTIVTQVINKSAAPAQTQQGLGGLRIPGLGGGGGGGGGRAAGRVGD